MSGDKPTWQLDQELAAMTKERDALALHLDAIGQSLGLSGFESRPLACYVDDLNQHLAARTLTWTDTPPTEPGWWWVCYQLVGKKILVVEVRRSSLGVLTYWQDYEYWEVGKIDGACWAGPIHPPEEG